MNEKELQTSWKQRFWIIAIAVVMLGSIIASYAAIVINGGGSSSATTSSSTDDATISEAKKQEYAEAYKEAQAEFAEATASDFNEFIKYKSKITAYNETSANGVDVKTEDLKEGTGDVITEDTEYYAYYVGWCADETVFDSTFDDVDNPTAFTGMIDASTGLIEGWNLGVEGMKINGIRMITIPGSLAYGDTTEICGGTNKPLRFIVMPKRKSDERIELYMNLETAKLRAEYAEYGIDYEKLFVYSE